MQCMVSRVARLPMKSRSVEPSLVSVLLRGFGVVCSSFSMLLVVETDLLNSGVLRLEAVTSKEQRKVGLLCNSPALFLL